MGLLAYGTSAHRAAIAGLVSALVVAVFGFGMPSDAALAAAGFGALFGLLPIGWIVVAAVFLFQLTVRTGQFEVVKRSVAAISPDRRIQALLIAFCFGSFVEGAAGFGTPVAISAALMIGLGFTPLYAAGLALIANTSPVAFGALGTPITTLAEVSGLPVAALSQMAGRQLPLFSLIVPAWLVATMSGWRGVAGCWPAIAVCGGSFASIQFYTANYQDPSLVDVFGGLGSLAALTVFSRFWRPRQIWRFADDSGVELLEDRIPRPERSTGAAGRAHQWPEAAALNAQSRPSAREAVYAWMPWAILSVAVFVWGWGPVKQFLNGGPSMPSALASFVKQKFPIERLHNRVFATSQVARAAPGSDRAEQPFSAEYTFNWLGTTGTGIFLAAILAAFWLRVTPGEFVAQFMQTLISMRWALLTIACMLALAYTTKYSGSDATLGLAFTKTGVCYPFFAPLLGWLGVALTGSDTSSNALFGNLQRITAEQLGLPNVLIVASNSTGGVMGKMVDAQSIVVAAVATGQEHGEGAILRFVVWHSIALACLMGLLTLAQAYWLTWMIPVVS